MGEKLDLTREVYNKAEYIKTIDTSFNELGVTSITEDQQAQPTVEEFFGLYNSLFYDIPALGDINSHQYLVKTSGEYINFDELSEEIAALQAEIAQLRGELLNLQISNVELENNGNEESATTKVLNELAREIELANDNVKQTALNLSNATSTSTNVGEENTSNNTTNVGSVSSGGGTSTGGSGAVSGGGGGGY